jgi:hypothetical protein
MRKRVTGSGMQADAGSMWGLEVERHTNGQSAEEQVSGLANKAMFLRPIFGK